MKDQYIKQVKKELRISYKMKKEIIRDLNEIFTSALENGETEQQIINRLGSPNEFIENTTEQLGIDITAIYRRKQMISIIIAFIVAIIALVVYCAVQAQYVDPAIIGQANAMTNISIEGTVNISPIILIIGIIAAAVAVVQIVRFIKSKWR